MNHIAVQPSTLPSLVDKASQALAGARSAAEVLEAKELAGFAYDAAKRTARLVKAKDAHDTLIAAAHRAQADALMIEAQAKMRLADEYDAAQERGELATRADQNLLPEQKKVSVADLGLTHKDIHEARQIRDAERAEPGLVRRAVDGALDRGDEPTKAEMRRAVMEAAQRAMRGGGYRPDNRNPHYVKPSASDTARTMVSSSLTTIIEATGGYLPEDFASGFPTPTARDSFMRRAEAVRDFLTAVLETTDA